MSRSIPSDLATAFVQPQVMPAILMEAIFDSGPLRLWTGYGDLNYDGDIYTGAGNLIGISQAKETQDLEAQNLVATLNGASMALIGLALNEANRTRRRPFRLYMTTAVSTSRVATEDEPGAVELEDGSGYILLENNIVTTPYRFYSGLMDHFEGDEDAVQPNLRLSIENILIIGQRAKVSRYTHEEQTRLYPGDMGLEFINRLQDAEITW